jgi:hypothetical protein
VTLDQQREPTMGNAASAPPELLAAQSVSIRPSGIA